MYYNTTQLKGDELNESRARAKSQTQRILDFFIDHPNCMYTPIEIHKRLGKDFLLTSVRRSMTDLTNEGYLIKTEYKFKQKYGAQNYKWTLNTQRNFKQQPSTQQLKIF